VIKQKIESWIKETLAIEKLVLEHPADMERGDFTFVSHSTNPQDDFESLNSKKLPEIEKIELANGRFINIFLTEQFFTDVITEVVEKGDDYGKSNLLDGQKIFIEHTQQNPFKEFHIGHLMPNTIGDSVARIIKANRAETKVASYHGDVGLHVAKAVWGKLQKPEVSWGEAYAYGASQYEDNKEKIVEINKKVYDRSSEQINNLYDTGRAESLESFEKIYLKLDSHFDFHFFESESGKLGQEIVSKNIGKVFEESEGAIIFKGENFEPKTHTRVFLSKEGLPTYEAKEVGLAKIKKEKWPDYTQSITVTANEQDSFFDVAEVTIGEIFPELRGKLKHLSHGMLKLKEGKMSSRTGNIITAESLIDQVKEKIKEKIDDDKIAEEIAIGAIKFSILRQAIGGDIIFDFDTSISFEGDSGPYLQYAAVRANSVLEKANYTTKSPTPRVTLSVGWKTTDLERMLYRFPEVVETAYKEYAPHKIVSYLLDLASRFNSFYANEKIIDESDPASPYKLALTQAVATVLKNGLYLLGIKVPERM